MKHSTARPPRTTLHRASRSSEKWGILKVIKDFPILSLWNLVLALGGLMLLVFFSSIQFLPELDIKSLLAVLAALAFVALFVVVVFGMSMLLPSIYMNANVLSKVDDRQLYLLEAACGILGCVLLIGLIFEPSNNWQYLIANLPYSVSFLALLIATAKKAYPASSIKRSALPLYFIKTTFWRSGLWAFWCLLPTFLLLLFLQNQELPTWEEVFLIIGFPFLLAGLSIAVGTLRGKQRLYATAIAGLASVFVLSFVTGRPDMIPQVSVARLGLSMPKTEVSIVLSTTGCTAVNSMAGKVLCERIVNSELGVLKTARIISRIGSQFVLHVPIDSSERTRPDSTSWLRLVVRSSDVVTWSYIHTEKN